MIEKLAKVQSDFQSGFEAVHVSKRDNYLPKIGAFDFSQDAEIARNFELRGEGDSPEEAFEDWLKQLKALPQQGRLLYWRVLPEVNSEKNFDTQKTRWQVYARGAILI